MKIINSLVIPTYAGSKPRWEVRVDLSGRRYIFIVAYNVRQEAWVLTIKDINGNSLIDGLIRLVPGVDDFLNQFRASSPGLPPGRLYLKDLEDRLDTAVVTRKNLSGRFALTYTEVKEA